MYTYSRVRATFHLCCFELQALSGRSKDAHWLDSQVQPHEGLDDDDNDCNDHDLKIVDTWNISEVDHFSVSKSGTLGVACFPYLRVILPGTTKVSQVLESNLEKSFFSTFVNIANKEHLAVAYSSNIRLWDFKRDEIKNVYEHDTVEKNAFTKICVIDDRTVAFATLDYSQDISHRIYILNINATIWSLGSVLMVQGRSIIRDLCCIKALDGSPLLALCRPEDQLVQAVELVGGRTRWESGKELMGEKCLPYGVSVDKQNMVFVADSSQHKIHLLSADDGLIYMSINVRRYGINRPVNVRVLGQYIYVGHWQKDTTQINKFA